MQARFWDKRSTRYDAAVSKHDAQYEKTIDGSRRLLAKSDAVLDFACASGEMSLDIAPHVGRLLGIDTSKKMIELASRKAHERGAGNIAFHQGDAFEPRLKRASYNAIIAFNIFHLLDDAEKVLARLHDLLAADGLLISKTPCLGERGWPIRLLIGLAQKVEMAPPICSLTIPELEDLVSRSGFEVLETSLWDEKNRVQWIVARKM